MSFRTLAAGTTPSWHELGPLNMPSYEPSQGRVNAVAFDPAAPNRFYVGAATGGVWRTTDGGVNYTPVTDQMPNLAVSSLVVDYSAPSRIFVATGDADGYAAYSIGVWKSEDGGATWSTTGLTFPSTGSFQIYKLIQHPTQSATLYAATTSGLYTTVNGGATWTNSLGTYKLYDLEFKPGDPTVLYLSGYAGGGGRFLRSQDSGANWTVIATGLPVASGVGRSAIATTAASPGTVYFLSSGSASYYGLWRSQDSGQTFIQMSGSGATDANVFSSMSSYTCTIAAAPDAANEVYVAGISPYRSVDGGVTWVHIRDDAASTMSCHVDFHALEWRGTALYVGTDGGLHRSTNRGTNWTDLSGRLGIAQIYAFSQATSNPNLIYTGQQDDGLNRWNGTSWAHVNVGDWGGSVIHPLQPATVYAFVHSSLYKTTDAWSSRQVLAITGTESGPFVNTSLVMDPVVFETLYAGLRNVWKTTDGGTTWNPLSSTFGTGSIYQLAVAPSNSAYIYVTNSAGELWVTQNAGASWTNTRANLVPSPTGRILKGIAISPLSPGTAYVTADGYGTGPRVYRTTDAGGTWSDYSGTLPVVRVTAIAAADGNFSGVYTGTDVGVYYRNSTMSDWIPFNAGLPNANIADLKIHRGSQKLRAATYGRGLWESSIVEAPPIVVTGGVTSFITAAVEGCDSLSNVTANTATDYSVVDTAVFDSAPASFHLASGSGVAFLRSILLNADYLPAASSTLQFRSRLGLATVSQMAHVQASTDGGSTWTDIYTQSGTDTSGESTFSPRNVSLAAYANTVIKLRFTYTVSGSYYPQTTSGIGWYFDTITFSNTFQIVPTNPVATIVNGTVNPQGQDTTAWFEYGVTASYGSQSPIQNMGSGTTIAPVTATLAGLLSYTTYHYRLVSMNADGTSNGSDLTFTTGSNNADLSTLSLSAGSLSPAFTPTTTSYIDSVPNATTSLTITPTVADANATVKVSGSNVASGTASAPIPLVVGSNSITITVTAQNGTTTNSYVINAQRNGKPVLTLPTSPVIAEATSSNGASVTLNVSASDAEDGLLTPVIVPTSGSTFTVGDTTVNVSATDTAGEMTNGTFTVRVRDTTAPIVAAHDDVPVEATSAAGASVNYAVGSASDVVGVTSLTYSQNSGTIFPIGATNVTITAKDAANNTGSGAFTVNVHDTTAPTIGAPIGDFPRFAYGRTMPDFRSLPVTADNVGVTSVSQNPMEGSAATLGDVLVTLTAHDAAGNAADTRFTVKFVRPVVPFHTTRLAQGAAAPGAGTNGLPTDAKLTSFGIPATDDDGDVAFVAKWKTANSSGTGLFLNDLCVAVVGGPSPIAGAKYVRFTDPVVDGGKVACIAKLSTGASAVVSNFSGPALEKIALAGEVATADGAKFKAFKSVAISNRSNGSIGIFAQLALGTGTPKTTAASDLGLWVFENGSLIPALREGGAVGGKTIKSLASFLPGAGSPGQGRGWLSFNGDPEVHALAQFTDKTQGVVIYNTDEATPATLSRAGDTGNGAPDIAGATFASYSLPARNGGNTTAFLATLTVDALVGVSKANARGIFLNPSQIGKFTPLARLGDETGFNGGKFAKLSDPVLSENGGVAFIATQKGSGIKGLTTKTLWWKPSGQSLGLLALGGNPAGDVPDSQWKSFDSLVITDRGPIFAAKLVPGKLSGISAKTASGVWACDFTGNPRALFRTGDTINGKTLANFTLLKATVGNLGVTRSFNNNAQVVWLAAFTDKSSAIIVTEVP